MTREKKGASQRVGMFVENGVTKVNLKRLDLSTIPDDCVCALVGSRGSGKSWLLRDLMHAKRHIPVGIVQSPTAKSTKFFDRFMCASNIHGQYSAHAIQKLIHRQSMAKENAEGYIKGEEMFKAFLVLDDCGYDKSNFNTKQMRESAMNGRHVDIILLWCMQYLVDIPTGVRGQIDYLFMFRDMKKRTLINLYENFFSHFPDFKTFHKVFKEMTKNRQCMVARVKGEDIEDSYFVYKAQNLDEVKWRIGRKNWAFAEANGLPPFDKKSTAEEARKWAPPPGKMSEFDPDPPTPPPPSRSVLRKRACEELPVNDSAYRERVGGKSGYSSIKPGHSHKKSRLKK